MQLKTLQEQVQQAIKELDIARLERNLAVSRLRGRQQILKSLLKMQNEAKTCTIA